MKFLVSLSIFIRPCMLFQGVRLSCTMNELAYICSLGGLFHSSVSYIYTALYMRMS